MAEKLLMLALSPTMDKGMIAEWLKREGDTVTNGDVLCEVETDKTAMDYESSADGVLLKIIMPEGSEAAIGDVIAIVGEEGEDITDLLKEAAEQDKDQAETGQNKDQADKKQTQSEQNGQAKTEEKSMPEDVDSDDNDESADSSDFIKASPLARKLADNNNLTLKDIKGSGPAGRIIKADVEKALKQASAGEPAKAGGDKTESVQTAGAQSARDDVVIPVSGKRKIIAQRLSESKFSAPHYYLKVSVEMDGIIETRKKLNAMPETKVSMNAFFYKFIAEALKKYPAVNASWKGDTIVQHGSIDIGIAVALDDGLITPVVRNCGNKGIIQIDSDLKELIKKARSNSLKTDEYTGATFTLSNLGSYGIEEFTAIINPPGSAILAVGAIKREPVVQPDDSLAIKSMMKLTLSCDHRSIDGSVGAEFLKELKDMMEAPVRVLF